MDGGDGGRRRDRDRSRPVAEADGDPVGPAHAGHRRAHGGRGAAGGSGDGGHPHRRADRQGAERHRQGAADRTDLVRSAEGRLRSGTAHRAGTPGRRQSPHHPGGPAMTGNRILVVEDNERNLKLVRDVLQYAGYDVIAASSGEQGVALARERVPDLVLMDLQLPAMDGTEALRILRADPLTRAIPVVAVTAFAMKDDRERALNAGFDSYIEKPISVRALADQVRGFLDRK